MRKIKGERIREKKLTPQRVALEGGTGAVGKKRIDVLSWDRYHLNARYIIGPGGKARSDFPGRVCKPTATRGATPADPRTGRGDWEGGGTPSVRV